MSTAAFTAALQRGADRQRLDKQEALSLVGQLTPSSWHELGAAARSNRTARFGERATFVFNLQINPSNICINNCAFCSYAATESADHAYSLDEETIIERVEQVQPTEAHIVGGLNEAWGYQRSLELIRTLRQRFPALHIKAFTAVEIDYFARQTGLSHEAVLESLRDAGLEGMPGGGAEIFSDRLQARHWPNKINGQTWIQIHNCAHRLGIETNATMLFGIGETWSERLDHLLALREAQERAPGFKCFIPLAFQPGGDQFVEQGPTPFDALNVIAISRLVLDNFDHIKSYWPSLGLATASAGLSHGADDMDGTIEKERIMHLAGSSAPQGLARRQMIETITAAGYTPVERDGKFNPIEVR